MIESISSLMKDWLMHQLTSKINSETKRSLEDSYNLEDAMNGMKYEKMNKSRKISIMNRT
jgi:predicted RNase H-related nuclease YkuK (DUF458 family)